MTEELSDADRATLLAFVDRVGGSITGGNVLLTPLEARTVLQRAGRRIRTIIVLTRVATDRVVATYINDVDPCPPQGPYIVSIGQNPIPPPVGLAGATIPEIGHATAVVNYWDQPG